MAVAAAVQVWKDVTDQINKKQGGWAVKFIAERKYQPKYTLEETDTVVVQTSLAAWRLAPDNRAEWSHEFDIEIGISFRADANAGDQATEQFDGYLKLAEEMANYWADPATRPNDADCPLTAINFGPGGDSTAYIAAFIEEHNSFTTVIRLTFQKLIETEA